MLRCERRAVHEEIEPAELAIERRGELLDLLIAGDVARGDDWIGQLGRQLADVFFEPLAGIGKGEATMPLNRGEELLPLGLVLPSL